MFCVLNTSHPDGQGGTWKNLSFYIDNQLVRYPLVQRYNDTAIRLYVENSTVSPNGPPHDFYGVTCKQNHVTGICVRHVYVGCESFFSTFLPLNSRPHPIKMWIPILLHISIMIVISPFTFDRSSSERDGFSVHLLQLGAARMHMARTLQSYRNNLLSLLSSLIPIQVRFIISTSFALKRVFVRVRVGFSQCVGGMDDDRILYPCKVFDVAGWLTSSTGIVAIVRWALSYEKLFENLVFSLSLSGQSRFSLFSQDFRTI